MLEKLLFAVLGIFFIYQANAATNVSGQIRSNTTWTKAGSPYIMTTSVEVAPGVTLTIEPGVQIEYYSRYCTIDVYGNIIATGTITDSITFSENPVSGAYGLKLRGDDTSIFKYCLFNRVSEGIETFSAPVIITNCYFKDVKYCIRVHTENSRPYFAWIENNLMENNSIPNVKYGYALGASGFGSLLFRNNKATNYFLSCYSERDHIMEITGNEFYNGKWDVSFGDNDRNTILRDNIIVGISSQVGLAIRSSTFDSSVSGNFITGCMYGMEITEVYGEISNNTLYQNKTGIRSTHSDTAKNGYKYHFVNNCIEKNTLYGYDLFGGENINVSGNWWGNPDSSFVDSSVKDFNDDFRLSVLSFMPVLQTKNTGCKSISVNPPPNTILEKGPEIVLHNIYPNPFKDYLYLSLDSRQEVQLARLYNITGGVVDAKSIQAGSLIYFNTSDLPQGAYLCQVIYRDGTTQSIKVVKQQ